MAEDTPAHRSAVTPRSGDTHVIDGAGAAKAIKEKDRKPLEEKAAEIAATKAAATERAAAKSSTKAEEPADAKAS